MTTKAHSTLTGSDLHEPKGIATATAGQVYVSDGAGGGTWQDTAVTAGATSFTTGDLKPTWKTVADSGWVMCDDGTIGDISSGATNLASSTTQALYYLLWTNISNSYAAVSGGRGVSAAADYAAHKTIAIPLMLGRALAVSGFGAGLNVHPLGIALGVEGYALTLAQIPAHTHTGTTSGQSADHTHGMTGATLGGTTVSGTYTGGGGGNIGFPTYNAIGLGGVSADHTHTFTTNSAGSSQTHSIMQPTSYVNVMVKL